MKYKIYACRLENFEYQEEIEFVVETNSQLKAWDTIENKLFSEVKNLANVEVIIQPLKDGICVVSSVEKLDKEKIC